MEPSHLASLGAAIALGTALASAAAPPQGQTFHESEPNDTKATANAVFGMADGDLVVIDPNFGSYDPDVFRVRLESLPPDIYRHELRDAGGQLDARIRILGLDAGLDEVLPHSLSILSDSTDGDPSNANVAWYGFGKAEELYVDLASQGYTRSGPPTSMVLTTEPITPHDFGSIAGTNSGRYVRIDASGATGLLDTEAFLFDAEFNLLPNGWIDDAYGFNSRAILDARLLPGTYCLAVSEKGLASHRPPSSDNGEWSVPSGVTDFRGALVAGGRSPGFSTHITIDPVGAPTLSGTLTATRPGEAVWVRFTIGNGQNVATFCEGDGTLGACPCGTDAPVGSGMGCVHTGGRGGALQRSLGNSPNEVQLHLEDLPRHAGTAVVLSLGTQSPMASLGGLTCLAPGAIRLPAVFADALGMATVIFRPADFGILSGSTIYAQAAYRDPTAAGGCQVNLTSGIAFTL